MASKIYFDFVFYLLRQDRNTKVYLLICSHIYDSSFVKSIRPKYFKVYIALAEVTYKFSCFCYFKGHNKSSVFNIFEKHNW